MDPPPFPIPLDRYAGEEGLGLLALLWHRVQADPLNLTATVIFLLAILHTFLAPHFLALSHRLRERRSARFPRPGNGDPRNPESHSFTAETLQFFGEVEAIFGIWAVPLLLTVTLAKGWAVTDRFISQEVNFNESIFVVVIMAIASTRPVLSLAERVLGGVAALGGRTPLAWWLSILTLGPLLGSLITEPAAMTISALLLARHLFELGPSRRLSYASLGLLFVNISIGGVLTPFAAPPVLMVAAKFHWGLGTMLGRFGWKAVLAILISSSAHAVLFRREFSELAARAAARLREESRTRPEAPVAIVLIHVAFLGWTVFAAHTPALVIAAFLFFLAFTEATAPHQDTLNLRPALLVGFFLAGLVVHGALQRWWIAPLLARLGAPALMAGSVLLTAVNDNAAITYLASLVPSLTETMRYAVVAGAVAGGGLTVIANAPNPAGQSILKGFFPDGISPRFLFLGALAPTLVAVGCLLLGW